MSFKNCSSNEDVINLKYEATKIYVPLVRRPFSHGSRLNFWLNLISGSHCFVFCGHKEIEFYP